MLQAPRQINRIAFETYSLGRMAEQPLQNRLYRQTTDGRIVAMVEEALSRMSNLIARFLGVTYNQRQRLRPTTIFRNSGDVSPKT
jgi:hypothetical protein